MSSTINLPKRRVIKIDSNNTYAVFEVEDNNWRQISKIYGHSTSAFAALGRITQNETFGKVKL